MPAVAFTPEQKLEEREKRQFREIKQTIEENNISYTAIAELVHITPQAVFSQFKKKELSRKVINAVYVLQDN
jgi:predicted XRE-type DNA-binding protein